MSDTSGRTSSAPFAYYDPNSSSWRTSQTTFDWGLPTSSPTLPASGSMRNGALRARRRSALPTSGAACSPSPGLPTPTARDWRGQGYDGQLPNAVSLLPTPRTSDTNGAGTHGDGGPDLRTVVALLPTPRASDGTKGGPNQRGSSGDLMLPSAVMLLPTPRARDHKGRDPNPRGVDLNEAVALLPTPTATDAKCSSGSNPAWGHGTTLTDAARQVASTGATTPPRSTDGPASSDGQLLLPLSPDDTDAPA